MDGMGEYFSLLMPYTELPISAASDSSPASASNHVSDSGR